jgi:hypothetical protein
MRGADLKHVRRMCSPEVRYGSRYVFTGGGRFSARETRAALRSPDRDEQLRVADNVDEEDMPDLEFNIR